MNRDPKNSRNLWKQAFIGSLHFVLHVAARLLLLTVIMATILMVFLILIFVFFKLHEYLSESEMPEWGWIKLVRGTIADLSHKLVRLTLDLAWFNRLTESLSNSMKVAATILRLFAGVSLITFFVKREDLLTPLGYIVGKLSEAIRGSCLPDNYRRKSLSESWQYYVKETWPSIGISLHGRKRLSETCRYYAKEIWPSIRDTFYAAIKLSYATFIILISLLLASKPAIHVFQWSVDKTVEIWNETSTTSVVIADLGDSSNRQSMSDLIKSADKFSLVYREGNLKTKNGICPEGSNLEWLRLFNAALSDSLGNSDRRKRVRVKGFASVSPVRVNGDTSASEKLNLKIANQRAEAVVYFLMLDDAKKYNTKACSTALDGNAIRKNLDTEKSDSIWKGTDFDVVYKPWNAFAQMDSSKPEPNPFPAGHRQFDLEFLNRSVEIIVETGEN